MNMRDAEEKVKELEDHHLEMSRIMGNVSASIDKTNEISYLSKEGMRALNAKFHDHSEKAFSIIHRLKMVIGNEVEK